MSSRSSQSRKSTAPAGAPTPWYQKKGVVITCENESEGVDASELDRLFDRFYRADQSRSSQTGGFGIGLSIARSVCEAHKGSIKAECDDGRTVRFIAHLK